MRDDSCERPDWEEDDPDLELEQSSEWNYCGAVLRNPVDIPV